MKLKLINYLILISYDQRKKKHIFNDYFVSVILLCRSCIVVLYKTTQNLKQIIIYTHFFECLKQYVHKRYFSKSNANN